MTIAEITDGFGEYFTETHRGRKDNTRTSKYDWPTQGIPNATIFRNWKRLLNKTFRRPDKRININLGAWYTANSKPSKWRISPNAPYHVFEKVGNRIKIWRRVNQHGVAARRPTYKYWQDGIQIPPNAHYLTYTEAAQNRITVTGHAPLTQREPPIYLPPKWGTPSILRHATKTTPEILQKLTQAIRDRKLHIISDGSYYKKYGVAAAGWLIDNGEEIIMRGKAQVPGNKEDLNSYRGELYGLLCGILHVLYSLRISEVPEGSVIIGCDGKGALDAVRTRFLIAEPNRKHWDIINSIWEMQDQRPRIDWTFAHRWTSGQCNAI